MLKMESFDGARWLRWSIANVGCNMLIWCVINDEYYIARLCQTGCIKCFIILHCYQTICERLAKFKLS